METVCEMKSLVWVKCKLVENQQRRNRSTQSFKKYAHTWSNQWLLDEIDFKITTPMRNEIDSAWHYESNMCSSNALVNLFALICISWVVFCFCCTSRRPSSHILSMQPNQFEKTKCKLFLYRWFLWRRRFQRFVYAQLRVSNDCLTSYVATIYILAWCTRHYQFALLKQLNITMSFLATIHRLLILFAV